MLSITFFFFTNNRKITLKINELHFEWGGGVGSDHKYYHPFLTLDIVFLRNLSRRRPHVNSSQPIPASRY